ncbi:MAG: hypothetical protein ACRDE2_09865 [Chitinophagaceae bacterium]
MANIVYESEYLTVCGEKHKPYKTQEERYDNIAQFFVNLIMHGGVQHTYIEGYSMGSIHRAFAIAENTEVLKHKLWQNNMSFIELAPTTIKKRTTGKGNADKQKMYDVFVEQTGIKLQDLMLPGRKLNSPITDVMDAYFIARIGLAI